MNLIFNVDIEQAQQARNKRLERVERINHEVFQQALEKVRKEEQKLKHDQMMTRISAIFCWVFAMLNFIVFVINYLK